MDNHTIAKYVESNVSRPQFLPHINHVFAIVVYDPDNGLNYLGSRFTRFDALGCALDHILKYTPNYKLGFDPETQSAEDILKYSNTITWFDPTETEYVEVQFLPIS